MDQRNWTIQGPYDEKAACEKCGHIDVSSVYREAGAPTLTYHEPTFTHAIIRRTCRRCFYGWFETPLDAAPTTGNEVEG